MPLNNTLTCIAVDDDKISLTLLKDGIARMADVTLEASFENPEEACAYLEANEVDLLFLDVEMPGMNGIEFLTRLSRKPVTIFITGHAHFALEAFKLDVVDYLIKPLSFESLLKSINKAKIFLKGNSDLSPEAEYVMIRTDGRFQKVLYEDILFAEAVKDYVLIHTRHNSLPVAMNLTTLSKHLSAAAFIRVHKSYLINYNNLNHVSKDSVLIGKQTIPIGKSFAEEFFNRFSEEVIIKR